MGQPQSQKLANKIPKPANSWYSLSLLLEHYAPATLTDAIDAFGVFVIDRVGRRVPASDDLNSSKQSKAHAISLLEDRYAELENPGPEYSWEAERWDTEPHPTYYFGWPAENIPDFDSLSVIQTTKQSSSTPKDWTQRPAKAFIEEKRKAGTYTAAGKLHGVRRQRYTEVYKKVVETQIPTKS